MAQAQTLSVTPATLNFNVQTGAALPGAQSFQITTTSATPVTYSVFVGPSTWAQASPTSGTVDATHPATVNVTLIQAGIPATSTSGQIFVTSATAGNATLTVNLNISSLPQL